MDTPLNGVSKATNFLGTTVSVHIDRPLHSKHPTHGFTYELNYGFVPNTTSPDGEELDAYIIGINNPIENFVGKCIAVIHRTNNDDDKLVVVPEDYEPTNEEIQRSTHFQEQFFNSVILR